MQAGSVDALAGGVEALEGSRWSPLVPRTPFGKVFLLCWAQPGAETMSPIPRFPGPNDQATSLRSVIVRQPLSTRENDDMETQTRLRDTETLPLTYRLHRSIDLKKDRRYSLAVQGIFVVVALAAVAAALLLDLSLGSSLSSIVMVPVVLAVCLVYMAVHEVTHGVVLQLLTRLRPSYAVRFPFLTTGSEAFLTKRNTMTVALAPSVIWGLALLIAVFALPPDYRLIAYIVLTLNFAGSAGDYVEAWVVGRQRHDVLVRDDGDKVHVFVPGI